MEEDVSIVKLFKNNETWMIGKEELTDTEETNKKKADKLAKEIAENNEPCYYLVYSADGRRVTYSRKYCEGDI